MNSINSPKMFSKNNPGISISGLMITALILSLNSVIQAASPDFSMVGFATLSEKSLTTTTGGAGGNVVEVNSFEEFKQYAEDLETPYIIIVNGEINTEIKAYIDSEGHIASSGTETTYGELVQVGNNKTIVGRGSDALLNRIGLQIQNKHNIIIRNLKFTMSDVPISKTDENKVVAFRDGAEVVLNDPDCIAISADSGVSDWAGKSKQASHNIWIDHCEFYNAYTSNKDRYDGLLDAKNNIYNATFSWNFFHNHDKGSLIGNSDSDSLRHEITIHHNHYKDIHARTPMMRYNESHVYNNYIEGLGTGNGPNVRRGSDIYFENNHFAGLSKAIFVGDDGLATIVGNYYEGCGNMMDSGCNSKKMKISVNPGTSLSSNDTTWVSYDDEIAIGKFKPSDYYSYKPDAVQDVKSLVTTYAGVGKIDISEYENAPIINPIIKSSSSVNPFSSSSENETNTIHNSSLIHQLNITVSGRILQISNAKMGAKYSLIDMQGCVIQSNYIQSSNITITVPRSGSYFIKIGNLTHKINTF